MSLDFDASERRRDRKLTYRDLARPTARRQPVARVGEREFQVGDCSGVGIGRGQNVGVLVFEGGVARAEDWRATVATDGLGVVFIRLKSVSHRSWSILLRRLRPLVRGQDSRAMRLRASFLTKRKLFTRRSQALMLTG